MTTDNKTCHRIKKFCWRSNPKSPGLLSFLHFRRTEFTTNTNIYECTNMYEWTFMTHAGRPQCSFLLTTAYRYFSDISHYEFGKMFITCITLSHGLKKKSKWWVSVSAQNLLSLWTLNPGPGARAALFEYMPFVRVLENITFCRLFTNRLRPFHDFNHHSNQQQPPFLFSSETLEAALSSLSLSIFCACNDVCISLSDSFKWFQTANVFAALVRASIWLCNVIVRYKLLSFRLFGRTTPKLFFFLFSAEHSVHPYFCYTLRCSIIVNIMQKV